MRKYLLTAIIAAGALLFSSCEFDTLPINVPISIPVALSGSNNTLSEQRAFCLNQYESYTDILEDMQSITYLQAAFRVDSVSNPNLTGNINLELRDGNNQVIFAYQLTNVKPSTYMTTPYIFPLTASQIQIINSYLSGTTNRCFTTLVQVSNISNAVPPHYVGGIVDMVFEAETEL